MVLHLLGGKQATLLSLLLIMQVKIWTMPRKFFWEFYREIKRVSGATCEVDWWNTLYCLYDAEVYEKLPELTFTLSGKEYRVPKESLYVPLEGY